MSSPLVTVVLPLFLPFLLFGTSSESAGDDRGTQRHYPSPTAAFDAYREACTKGDWRGSFSCLTPDAQDEAIFESFFECAEVKSKESNAILRKYVELTTLNDDYKKQYKKKHGIDLAKVTAGHENDPKFVPPASDRGLLRDVVAGHVKDKVGFFEAVGKHMEERISKQHKADPNWPLGELEDLVVHGDTATGKAKETILPRRGETPLKPGQVPPVYERPFRFRRINGGWLLD